MSKSTLAARIKAFEESQTPRRIAGRMVPAASGKGFHKPGSNKK